MKILIDARLYGLHHRGLGRYLVELIKGIISADKINQYILLIDPATRRQFPVLPPNIVLQEAPYRVYGLSEQILIPRLIKKLKPDLVHWTERASRLPGLFYWFKVTVYRCLIKRLVKKANRIITVSQTVAADLKYFYPFASKKIVTIYLAPAELPRASAVMPNNPYLLAVGAAYPHKNLDRVITAVSLVRKKIPNLELYLVGRIDFFADRLKQSIKSQGYSDWVKFLGQVSDKDLSNLYQGCQAYLLLSLQEGFGLGPLEAISQGALVIASDIPVLREVLNNGALLADPSSLASMVETIVNSFKPEVREQTLTAAKHILKKYSWSETVNKTLKIYQEAIVK
ncbi:MAG: Glycosyl transferase group 1 [Parcubacteria group bacterium GW2011_GWB1_43_66]|nr:MAG: Glycosyl transferase group 1 [Parcubacteria group bacterium GW2011_GWB1_43_66]